MQITIKNRVKFEGVHYSAGSQDVAEGIAIKMLQQGVATNYVNKKNNNILVSKTAAGSYIGNGTSQSFNLGFRPSFVVIRAGSGEFAVFTGDGSFLKRTNFFLNNASIRGDFGIVITEDGFSVGNDRTVNLLGGGNLTYYYFAYCDNGSNSFLQAGYAGNATSGRKVDSFEGIKLKAAFVKRDSGRAAVWMFGDNSPNYFYNGTNNVISPNTLLDGNNGVLTTGSTEEINQWDGLLGEGMYYCAFPEDASGTFATKYTGTGSNLNIILPWEPDCFIVVSRNANSAGSRIWLSSFPANSAVSLSSSGTPATGDFTVTRGGINRNLVTISAASAVNTAGNNFVLMAWKKNRNATYFPIVGDSNIYQKTVVVNNTGYIDCGTDDSLAISNDITMEFYGLVTNIDATQYAAGGDLDNDAGNQGKIVPLIFRSGGADRTFGAVSYGMAVTAGPVTTDQWIEPNLLICNHDRWQIVNSLTGIELNDYPTNTGVTVELGKLVHIIVTHKSQGNWNVYVNGFSARETKLDRNVEIGRPNVRGYAGHRTMILARQRDAISNTNGGGVKLAALYNRALSADEARQNYLSLFNEASRIPDYVEMWTAENVTSNTMMAFKNPANNGNIVNGSTI